MSPLVTCLRIACRTSVPVNPKALMDRFGEKLQAIRVSRGMTQKDLASRLGYKTHSYISMVEKGERLPTALLALRVSRAFGVTTDAMLKDEMEVGAGSSEE